MYYGRKKGIMIAIVSLFILIVVGGILTYLFLATDVFKSNDALFFKYLGQVIDEAQFTKNPQLAQIESLEAVNPYQTEGTLTFNIDIEDKDAEINKLNNTEIKIASKFNKEEEKGYVRADVYSKQENVFTLEYANSNNIYALKSDEIVTAYIGVENDSLKKLSQSLFPQVDTTMVPNQVETQNYEELFKITDQEKAHIYETYMEVIKDNLPKSAFTKEKDTAIVRNGVSYNATGYRLNLNGGQIKALSVATLRTLKTDSITLNLLTTKAKILGLDERFTSVNELTKVIDEEITNIINSETNPEDISIIVYVQNGEAISTEFIVKNNVKFTLFTKTENASITRNLLISNIGASEDFGTIEINTVETRENSKSTLYGTVNMDDTNKFTLYVSNIGTANEGYLNTEIEATYEQENSSYHASYKQKLEFVDELQNMVLLNRTNCGVLNDYATERSNTLIDQIGERVLVVLAEKAEIIGLEIKDPNVEPTINEIMKAQDIEKFNASFDAYKGEINGNSLKTLNTIINKLNKEKDAKRKVVLTINGVNVSAAGSSSIKTAENYIMTMQYDDEGYINQINANLKVQ